MTSKTKTPQTLFNEMKKSPDYPMVRAKVAVIRALIEQFNNDEINYIMKIIKEIRKNPKLTDDEILLGMIQTQVKNHNCL